MSSEKYKIDFWPGAELQGQTVSWMRKENLAKSSFYHYPESVSAHAGDGTLAVISVEGTAFGYITWDTFGRAAHISVAAIAVPYRGSGAGRFFAESVIGHIQQQGAFAVYLECAPASSQDFWQKLGFLPMPDIPGYTDKGVPSLYRLLNLSQENSNKGDEIIQIHEYGREEMTSWPVNYQKGTKKLIQTIVAPAYGDWCIQHLISGQINASDKIKKFRSGTCYDDPFLIITEL